MKKKVLIAGTALLLVLAMGTTAYAIENGGSLEQMMPHMKKAHPNLSEEQLKEMYDSCHSGSIDSQDMMRGSGMAGMMKAMKS